HRAMGPRALAWCGLDGTLASKKRAVLWDTKPLKERQCLETFCKTMSFTNRSKFAPSMAHYPMVGGDPMARNLY
ncbi:MAG: hypothetical protein ACFCBU_09055, partial [Cyanophyceae cyanobacterium]